MKTSEIETLCVNIPLFWITSIFLRMDSSSYKRIVPPFFDRILEKLHLCLDCTYIIICPTLKPSKLICHSIPKPSYIKKNEEIFPKKITPMSWNVAAETPVSWTSKISKKTSVTRQSVDFYNIRVCHLTPKRLYCFKMNIVFDK